MSENVGNVVEEVKVEEPKTEETQEQVVIEQPGKGKKILKWVLGGIAVVITAATAIFLGTKNKGDNGEGTSETDSADNSEAA